MSSSRSNLGTFEAFSVGGAVIGSAIAYFTKQAILGLAPVSVALILNLINRRRLEAFLDQSADVTTEVQQLRRDITLLSTSHEKFTQDLQNLVPQQELASQVARIETLHDQQEGLRLSLVPIQSRLDDLIQQFQQRPELEEIESLTIVIEALKQSIDQLPQQAQSATSHSPAAIEPLQKALDLLHYQFDNRPEVLQIEGLSSVIEDLKQSIDLVSFKNQSPATTELQNVSDSTAKLSQNTEQVERLQKSIDLLELQLEQKIWELRQETLANKS